MFELPRLLGSRERSIALETRLGNRVENAQGPKLDRDEYWARRFRQLCLSHADWEVRKQVCGIYNCFGHVWASRRTGIYDQQELDKILQDDGYRKLNERENPLIGDLALYLRPGQNELWHAGLVNKFQSLIDPQSHPAGTPAAIILSKINNLGEIFHHFADIDNPFESEGNMIVEFWTDRPATGVQ